MRPAFYFKLLLGIACANCQVCWIFFFCHICWIDCDLFATWHSPLPVAFCNRAIKPLNCRKLANDVLCSAVGTFSQLKMCCHISVTILHSKNKCETFSSFPLDNQTNKTFVTRSKLLF